MKRPIRAAAGITVTALAVLTLAACKSSIAGQQVVATAGSSSAQTAAVSSFLPTGGAAPSVPVASSAPASLPEQSAASSAEAGTVAASQEPASSVQVSSGSDGSDPATTAGSDSGSGSGSSGSGSSGSGSNSGSGNSSGGGSNSGSGSSSSKNARFLSASAGCVLDSGDDTYHLIVSWELDNATGMALSVDNPGLVGSYGTYSWHGSQDLSTLGCYAGDRVQDIELYSVGGTGQAKKTFHVHENHTRITPPPFASGGISAATTPPSTTAPATTTEQAPETTTASPTTEAPVTTTN